MAPGRPHNHHPQLCMRVCDVRMYELCMYACVVVVVYAYVCDLGVVSVCGLCVGLLVS